ncbi:MAG TPA: alpha-1,4-glucan--maltose-1-phosphate maltosyltransferase [Actinospica sp.]|nr:alpha-1,4-glucan--maltose-1-phosphate maltosyltransferase [Actinospica sp.]
MIGRIPLLDVQPRVLDGARPAKAVPGESFPVSATVFREGHDAVAANVVLTDPDGRPDGWHRMREVAPGTDRYEAWVQADRPGEWTFHVEAWDDPIATWYHVARAKIPAGQDVEVVFADGAALLERAAATETVIPVTPGQDVEFPGQELLEATAELLRDENASPEARLALAERYEVHEALSVRPLREHVTASEPLPLRVDRERALYGSWYEFFPRSEGARVDPLGRNAPVSGTFRTAAERLPAVAAMGFDVVYLPPIHPIGTSFRKGANNSLTPGEHDPGSPWGIGSPEGGHDAVHPELGTLKDFDDFVARATELGLEIALDFALQCSPDHPWVEKHPEWFRHRSDGTIAYAENPPKKYQDIYPIHFDTDLPGLLDECERVLRHWMAHGVRIFRVDNPHTKPVAFWEVLLDRIHASDPDVLFLAEAFTRPAMMHTLAAIGFHQSYTYFTWRNAKGELEDYLRELSGDTASFLRPNFFVNTPDILHAYLQHGGRPAFEIRAILAASLAPTWGVYSGYELCENLPAAPGSEEYLDSEKYQLRPRDWAAAEAEGRSLAPLLTRLNTLRRNHRALQGLRNLHFHHTDNDAVLCYSKRDQEGDTVIAVVNLDPHSTREATVHLDLPALGLGWTDRLVVHDELGGGTFHWGRDNYIRLDPHENPAHLLTLRR